MNSFEFIKYKQHIWADSKDFKLIGSKNERGEKNYTHSLEENLFVQLTEETEKNFKQADGHELSHIEPFPCKMQAIHSSSALAVNIFEYWKDKDISVIASSCGLCKDTDKDSIKILFEQKFPISVGFNRSPNIDVLIENTEKHEYEAYGIECNFSEAYTKNRSEIENGLKEKYFNLDENIWMDIPETYLLAKSISPTDNKYAFLHTAQLIKHILGLKKKYGKEHFKILYLWYDVLGECGCKHRHEIESFSKIVKKDNMAFHSISYQELIFQLHNRCTPNDVKYLEYIEQRYI